MTNPHTRTIYPLEDSDYEQPANTSVALFGYKSTEYDQPVS